MLIYDPLQNEAPDDGRPIRYFVHMSGVHRKQPWHEIDSITLIYLPEYLVKIPNHQIKFLVIVGKTGWTHVFGEHVSASFQNDGFDVDWFIQRCFIEFSKKYFEFF